MPPHAHTMIADTNALLAFDRNHVWHPYTSMTAPAPTQLVSGASGTRLTLKSEADGSTVEVIDAMSSWWAAIHGYQNPALDAAAHAQLDDFSHVMFGGLTNKPALDLAQRLVALSPAGLEHVFLADSGSVSIEVALKMALQYQRGVGRAERTKMLAFRGGYHGDTCGCMGVCDPDGGMHAMWQGFLPEHVFADRPPADVQCSAMHAESVSVSEQNTAMAHWRAGFEALAAKHAGKLAGIIVEPRLQGAGGMYPYPIECLQIMRDVADRHGLVLIFDEIATGFGRTGSLFAAEAAPDGGVVPDVLCVGKALTGGYMTLAAALCTTKVAHGISESESGVLMHGPTYMGNPLACAVATASLDLLTATNWAGRVAGINRQLAQSLMPCRALPNVADVRTLGAIGVVELKQPVDMARATQTALTHGVWLRPFRNLIYTMPPYIASEEDIATICAAIKEVAAANGNTP